MTPRTSARRRWISTTLMYGGLLVGIWQGVDAWRTHGQLKQIERSMPLRARLDLTQPGTSEATFHQTSTESCKQVFCLQAPDTVNLDELSARLKGLEAVVRVADSSGETVGEYLIDVSHARPLNKDLLVSHFKPLPIGNYLAAIEVRHPANDQSLPMLTLVSRYQFCGLEFMPVLLQTMFAGAGLLVALSAWSVRFAATINDSSVSAARADAGMADDLAAAGPPPDQSH